jgi:AcrR family transcriptional regulator
VKATRRDGRARREALLDAALRCFERRGLLAAGIEDIRKEAGASPSSVYHLFADREALIVALLLRTFERLFGALAAQLAGCRAARHAVHALVRGHIRWVLAHPAEARFMYQATSVEFSPSAGRVLTRQKAKLLAPVLDAFGAHLADGSLPSWSPLQLDVVLLGPSHEACRRYLAGAELDPDWLVQELPQLAWRSVAPGRAGRASSRDRGGPSTQTRVTRTSARSRPA